MLNMLVDIVDISSVCVSRRVSTDRFYSAQLTVRRRAVAGEASRRRGETRRYKRLGAVARASVTHSHSLELPGILHTMKGWQVGVSITVPAYRFLPINSVAI